MNIGFRKLVKDILKRLSMINGIGFVSDNSKSLIESLQRKGYYIETDLDNGGFDFIYLSKRDNSIAKVEKALTKLNFYGIMLVNTDDGIKTWRHK